MLVGRYLGDLEGEREAAATVAAAHGRWYADSPCCCGAAAGLTISSPSPGSSFNFSDSWARYVFSSVTEGWSFCRMPLSPRSEATTAKVSVLLMGFQFMLVEFQPASWSSLPECLLCGLQTPTSDKEITALQSLLNQLPQFPESPDRLTHIQSLIFYSDSTAAQWGKNSLFNKQGWSIGNPYEKNASYFIPHTIYKI